MENVIVNCVEMYKQYFGVGTYLTMFLLSMIYICFFEKKKVRKKYFIGFLLIFSIIYWCPLTAYIIMEYCIGGEVYWRMFWLLPMTITIAYVVVNIVDQIKNKYMMWIPIAVFIVFVWYNGSTIYDGYTIIEAENAYKLDEETIEICDIIKADAEEKGIKQRGVIVANELVNTIKQYDGEIRMPYGRDMIRGIDGNPRAQEIFFNLNNPINLYRLVELAREDGYQYLVYHKDVLYYEFTAVGYTYLGKAGDYWIYCLEG